MKDKDRKVGLVFGNVQVLDELDKGHADGLMGEGRSLMGHEKEKKHVFMNLKNFGETNKLKVRQQVQECVLMEMLQSGEREKERERERGDIAKRLLGEEQSP